MEFGSLFLQEVLGVSRVFGLDFSFEYLVAFFEVFQFDLGCIYFSCDLDEFFYDSQLCRCIRTTHLSFHFLLFP